MHLLLAALLFATTIGNADVVKLVKAGLSPETIEAKIAASETSFDTSTDALVALANEGVPDRVIRAMIEKRGAGSVPAVPPAAGPAAARRASGPPHVSRRYDVTLHVDGGGKCEGELRIDGKGVKFSRCRKLDFEVPWSKIAKVCYDYGFRGVVVIGEHRISVTTPAEAKKIVEHIRAAAPAVTVTECE